MAYINGTGIISPQNTLPGAGFLEEVCEYTSDYLKCVEPVYRTYLDPIVSRRMSRLIKMGISSARMCLQDAGLAMPDAIITGTGLGSVEDTEKILGELTVEERFLNPTPFIQSTYNTISSQIAINLKCLQYNSTYVHRSFSLESALLDALLQLSEGNANNVLCGGIDEMTMNHLTIIRRQGIWKNKAIRNLDLWDSDVPGALAGEGSAYFLVSSSKSASTYSRIQAVEMMYKPGSTQETASRLKMFLEENGSDPSEVDLVLMGNNGNYMHDQTCNDLISLSLPDASRVLYKHLCGEYHTAAGFAMYVASRILRSQAVPAALITGKNTPQRLETVLIHNHFMNVNHSFILLKR